MPRTRAEIRNERAEATRDRDHVKAPAQAVDVAGPAEQAEPKVHHDRKKHPAAEVPDPVAQASGEAAVEPRKASTDDFMTATPADAMAVATLQATTRTARKAQKEKAPVATVVPVKPVALTAVLKKVPKPAEPEALELEAVAVPNGPALYDKRGRLIVPPALKGTHEILVHQNQMADLDGLDRIQDDEDLERMRASKMLVAFPEVKGLQADERLPENRRFTRPWTAQFLAGLAKAHYQRFHTALQVNSAVRTVEFQQKLMRTNGNAAPPTGETASPHLTGQAVDLAKKGLSMAEIAWMRGYLGPLMRDGKVDVEEEFQQACFHISVYKKYLPAVAPKKTVVASHQAGTGVVGMR